MSRSRPYRLARITLIFVLGVGLSLWLFLYFDNLEHERREDIVQESIVEAEYKLQAELRKIPIVIRSLHLLIEQTDTIDRATFQAFSAPYLKNIAGIRAIEWAPYIPLQQRPTHEAKLRSEGFDWYEIRIPNAKKRILEHAPDKSFYLPIQYIEPASLSKIALGYDLSASPKRFQVIQESRMTNCMVVSDPMRLIPNGPNSRSILIGKTVQKADTFQGVVLGVYNMEKLVNTILQEELAYLDFFLFDHMPPYAPIYSSQDTLTALANLLKPDWAAPDTLYIQNRTWLIYCIPKASFFDYSFPLEAYGFSIVVLLITLMLLGTLLLQEISNSQLGKKVTERTQQLHRANTEQAVLLKEIHHRVKNNLQVITGLLSLQASSITDPEIKALFSVSQYRINAMAMLHEQLYQSENLSSINYGIYLQQMVEQLILSMKGDNHQIQVDWAIPDHLQLNLDTAIPLGLLINELVTNSLKYGFPDDQEGVLYIHILPQKYPDFLLHIGDNGIGFSTIPAPSPNGSSSLGLRLVHQLSRQLNGTVERDHQPTGTHFKIHFQEVQ